MRTFILYGLGAAIAVPAMAQADRPPVSAEARERMVDFARCVVRASPDKAHSALTRDFRTTAYRQELRVLAANNRSCMAKGGMRATGLPFAAAMAEALLEQGDGPLNVRLVRAAPTDAPTFAPSDAVAMCVARSDPDGVAALFATRPASHDEAKASAALGLAVGKCTPPAVKVDLAPFGLRSILATASYRLLAAAGVPR